MDLVAGQRRGLHTLAGAIIVGAALIFAGLYAYYVVFSTFAPYDDEGYLDISLRHFIQGWPIYDQVFTQYGPFYYLFHGALFGLASVPVDSDSMRVVVAAMWIASAGLASLAAARMSGRWWAAIAALVFVTVHLRRLAHEPGHPQGLCVLLFMCLPAIATFLSDARRALVCAFLGVCVGLLLMSKMNIGAFALLAVALTLSSAIPGRLATVARIAVSVAVLALPVILMRAHLSQWLTLNYACLTTLAALPVVLLHWTERSPPYLSWREGFAAALGCAGAIAISSLGVVLHGTSLRAIVVAPFEQAARFPAIRWFPPTIVPEIVYQAAAVVALLVAMLLTRRRWKDRRGWELTLAAMKVGYGAWALSSVYLNMPVHFEQQLGHYSSYASTLLYHALPWVGLMMFPSPGVSAQPRQRFARALLCSGAVVNVLQAYPVAGSQLAFATVLVVLVAVVCLADGLQTVRLLVGSARRLGTVTAGAVSAGLVLMQWNAMRDMQRGYASLTPLDLPGARRLRMPETSAALYRWLSLNLDAYADTFIGIPALNSLYVWTEKEPPTLLNPNWLPLLDDRQQESVVAALAQYPDACGIVIPRLNEMALRDEFTEEQPLARYVRDEFRTVGTFAGHELSVRKERRVPELIYCARPQPQADVPGQRSSWVASMSVPTLRELDVHRMAIVDVKSGRTVADSASGQLTVRLEDSGDGGEALKLEEGVSLDRPRRFVLTLQSPAKNWSKRDLIVRLFDERDRIVASLPVVS